MNCFKKKRKKRERFLRKEQGRDSASYSVVHVSSNRNLERHHNKNTREEQSSSQSESTASPRGYEEEDASYVKKKKRLWSKKPSPERHHDQMQHPRHTSLHEKNGNDRNRRHVKGHPHEYEEEWEKEDTYHSDKRRTHRKSSPHTRHNEVPRRSPDHHREGDNVDQSSSQSSSRKQETNSKSSNSHEKHGRRRMKNSSPPPKHKEQMKPPSPVQTENQEIVRGGAAEDPELLKELLAISAKHNKASERFSKVRKGAVPARSAPVMSKKSKQATNELPPWMKRRDIPKKDSLVRFAQNVTYSEETKAKEMMNDDENETPSWTAADDEKVQNLNGHIEVLKGRLARLAEKKQQRIANARRYNRDPAANAETQKIHRALIKVNNDLDRAENEAREMRRKKREFETYQNVQEEIVKQEKKRQEKLHREKEMGLVRRELELKREKKEMKRLRHAHRSHDDHSSQDHYSGSYRANIDHLSPKNSYSRRPLDDDHYSSSYRANIEHLSPHDSAKKRQFIDLDEDDDDLKRILDDQSVSMSIEETSSDSREDPSYKYQDEKVKGYVDINEPEDDEYEKFKQTLENSYHLSEFGSEYLMDDVEDEDLLFDREMKKMKDDDEFMEHEDFSINRDDGRGKGDHERSQDKRHQNTHEDLVGLSKKANKHADNMRKSHSHGKRKTNEEGKKLDRNIDPVEEKDASSTFDETKENTGPITSGDIIENIEENTVDSPGQSWNKEERGISYRFICTYPFWKLHAIMLDHVYIENQEAGLQLKDGMMRIQRVYDGEVNNPIMKKLLTIKLSYPGWEHDKKEALEHYLCFEDKEARDACVEIVKKHKKYKMEMAQKENSTDSTKDSTGGSTQEENVSEVSNSGAESSLQKGKNAKLQRENETRSKDDGTYQSDLSGSLKRVMPLDAFDKVNFDDIGDWSVDKSSAVDRGRHSDKNDNDVFGSVDYSTLGDWSSSRNEKRSIEKSAPKRWEKPERRQTLQDIYEEEWKPWTAKEEQKSSGSPPETVPNNFHSVDWKPVNRGTVLETQDTYSSSSSTPRETRRNIENKWMKQLHRFSQDRERPHSRDEVRSKLREIEERWRGRTIMT